MVVHETHTAVVFLAGDTAIKVKKPVAYPFLDFSTQAARAAACRREVELNRRLAPDVYLGTVDLPREDGTICETAVLMRRLPEALRLSNLVTKGAPVMEHLRRVATVLAEFHRTAERGTFVDAAGSPDAVLGSFLVNADGLAEAARGILPADLVARARELGDRYVTGRAPLFAERAAGGHVRDGHGDLIADDVFCLPDGPRILDCLEFSDELRYGDVLADVAFLAMDLERLGAPLLAKHLVDWWAEAAGESFPRSLLHFYVAHRALIRAKVACLRVAQGDRAAAVEARRFLDLALRHLTAGEVRLVLVGGLPGAGKTTLAREVAHRDGWVSLNSDAIRKELYGGHAVYTPDATRATYAELIARARDLLAHGESVVLDATWLDPARRAAAHEVADLTGSRLVQIRCDVPENVAAQRVQTRHDGVSDATPEVVHRMAGTMRPWKGARPIDTTEPMVTAVEEVLDAVGPARVTVAG